jgi:hypothetical protein
VSAELSTTNNLQSDNWLETLLPDLAAHELALLAPEREGMFDALLASLKNAPLDGVVVDTTEEHASVAADAPLLLPGIRLHIPTKGLARDTIFGAIRIVALVELSHTEAKGAAIALSLTALQGLYEKASRLEPTNMRIVEAVASLGRGGPTTYPDLAQLSEVLQGLEDLSDRLESLEKAGVLEENGGRWKVVA